MALSHFTEGVNLYKKYTDQIHADTDALTKITQIYTNRALAYHNIGSQEDAFEDSNYVLESLDPKNTKALFRRSHCYKLKS